MTPARVSDKSHLIEGLEDCESGIVNNGCFGKINYCPAVLALDNQRCIEQLTQEIADSTLEAERKRWVIECIANIYEDRRGVQSRIRRLAIERNLGVRVSSEIEEEKLLGIFGMTITPDPGFGYGNPKAVYEV